MNKKTALHNPLTVQALSKSFTQGEVTLHVLKNVSFSLQAGEVVALVGQSGAGKSTLLQCSGLLDDPTSGDVLVDGMSVLGASDTVKTRARGHAIGFVYQYHHLLPEFTALDNVAIPQMIIGVDRAAARERAQSLLERVGLGERLEHQPGALSGGEQQRVAIARAIANRPKVLLADEPTGNLDEKTGESVFQLLLSLAKSEGLAALIATHNMTLAHQMDRILSLHAGVLKEGA